MKSRYLIPLLAGLLLVGSLPVPAQVPPQIIHYQGRVADNNGNFNGDGHLKFALVSGDGSESYWINGGVAGANFEPSEHLVINVDHGLFSVLLGSAGPAIPYSVFDHDDVRLRVWFRPANNNGAFEMFTPDQRIVSVGYAMRAHKATEADTVPWTGLVGIPADLADGDSDTTYTAGQGLTLAGTTFSLNTTYTDGRYWKQNGNSLANGDFLGSLNNVPLELRAPGGIRVHELTPSLSFGNQTRQMINLYDSTYGLGVQNFTAYSRSHGGYAWYRDGIHSDLANDPGAGGTRLLTLEGEENRLTVFQANGQPGSMIYGNASGGALSLRRPDGNPAFQAWGNYGNGGGRLSIADATGTSTVDIVGAGDADNQGGQITLRQANGTQTIQLDAEATAVGGGGYLALYKSDGTASVVLRADHNGNGRVTTQVLQITGGSDLSEQFHISNPAGEPEPGMLVSIDPKNPGHLVQSSRAYDRTVAGIVSGAGGVRPGMLMGQADWSGTGKHPVALTGRVYCQVDAEYGAIEPGDLITTSATPGHGMKVTDHARAQGAIIGKAMTAHADGKGLVLVLVTLQ